MAMTVADLQAALALLPSGTPVVLAEDAEGNGFSPPASAQPALYRPENTWSGEWYPTEEQRLAQDDPDEYSAAPDDSVAALFLWPVN